MDGLEFENHRRGFDFRFGLTFKFTIPLCLFVIVFLIRYQKIKSIFVSPMSTVLPYIAVIDYYHVIRC